MEYVRSQGAPIVLKADGLALGKGVLICKTLKEAEEGLKEIMLDRAFGKAGDKIPVDYCERRFVKKPPKAKAGFVIYTDFKTLLATPDRHAEAERL